MEKQRVLEGLRQDLRVSQNQCEMFHYLISLVQKDMDEEINERGMENV